MAQHINTNQLHPAMVNQIPMLQAAGLNLTIMSTGQQHGLPQFAQSQPGMYQIVQQAPGQAGHVQLQGMQNVQLQQHQFHQLQNPQFNQQQQQITHQQVQQLNNHHQLNNHTIQLQQQNQTQQIQQIQHQSTPHQENNGTTNNQQTNNNSNNNNNNQQPTKQQASKKKKPKINKDGVPAPKRATTAYINFTQWYRESIKKTGRTVPKIGEFGKECAAKWNSMTEEEKKPFTEVAARDRDRYRREMEIYKPARDANKPKRPGTAFMLFMVDFRKEVAGKEPEGGVAALAKLGGERWRNMTDEEKKPYCDKQNECKLLYEQKMEEYKKLTGQPVKQTNSNKTASSVKSEVSDSDTSEQLNNSLSNSNLSNNKLNNDEHHIQNHNNLTAINSNNSPGSQLASPHTQQTMSPQDHSQSQLSQIASSIPLQSQTYYTNFLEQQHDDGSYNNQNIDQQHLQHDGHQTQEQNDQQTYLQNGVQNYYNWN